MDLGKLRKSKEKAENNKRRRRSSKYARRKGNVVEREIVRLHKEAGIQVKKVPLSGAAPGDNSDLEIMGGRREGGFDAEVKYREFGKGFLNVLSSLYEVGRLPAGKVNEYTRLSYPDEGSSAPTKTIHVMTWEKYLALLKGGWTMAECEGLSNNHRENAGSRRTVGTVDTWLDTSKVDMLFLRVTNETLPTVVLSDSLYGRLHAAWQGATAGTGKEERLAVLRLDQAQEEEQHLSAMLRATIQGNPDKITINNNPNPSQTTK